MRLVCQAAVLTLVGLPAAAECGLLLRLSDIPRHTSRLVREIGTERQASALFEFEETLARMTGDIGAHIAGLEGLAPYAEPLRAYVAAFEPLPNAVARKDRAAAQAVSASYGAKIGAILVERLVEDFDCETEEQLSLDEFPKAEGPIQTAASPPSGTGSSGGRSSSESQGFDQRQEVARLTIGMITGLLAGGGYLTPHLLRLRKKRPWREVPPALTPVATTETAPAGAPC